MRGLLVILAGLFLVIQVEGSNFSMVAGTQRLDMKLDAAGRFWMELNSNLWPTYTAYWCSPGSILRATAGGWECASVVGVADPIDAILGGCANNTILVSTGSTWACVVDNDGGRTRIGELTDGQIWKSNGATWGAGNDEDTLATLTCSGLPGWSQHGVLRRNAAGTAWECANADDSNILASTWSGCTAGQIIQVTPTGFTCVDDADDLAGITCPSGVIKRNAANNGWVCSVDRDAWATVTAECVSNGGDTPISRGNFTDPATGEVYQQYRCDTAPIAPTSQLNVGVFRVTATYGPAYLATELAGSTPSTKFRSVNDLYWTMASGSTQNLPGIIAQHPGRIVAVGVNTQSPTAFGTQPVVSPSACTLTLRATGAPANTYVADFNNPTQYITLGTPITFVAGSWLGFDLTATYQNQRVNCAGTLFVQYDPPSAPPP